MPCHHWHKSYYSPKLFKPVKYITIHCLDGLWHCFITYTMCLQRGLRPTGRKRLAHHNSAKKIPQVRSQRETTDVQVYITPANFQLILMHVLVAWMRLFCMRKGVTAALTLYAALAPNPSTPSGLCHKKKLRPPPNL